MMARIHYIIPLIAYILEMFCLSTYAHSITSSKNGFGLLPELISMFFQHLASFASVTGGVKLFSSKGAALNILRALAAPPPLQSNDSAQGLTQMLV